MHEGVVARHVGLHVEGLGQDEVQVAVPGVSEDDRVVVAVVREQRLQFGDALGQRFDGKDDVLVALCGKNLLGIYTQDGDGNLTLSQTLPLPYASSYNPHGLATGDINGDGAVDITLADPNHGMVVMYHAPPPEPLPDVIASWTEFSVDYADSTQKAEGYLQVANIGNREASGVQISYYLSENDLLDGMDILVGKEIIRSLPPGKTIWPRFDYRAEIYLQGEFIIAVIDPENRLHESDEANNLTETPLAHHAEYRNKVVEKKAFVRQACPSNFCSNFMNKIGRAHV